MPKAVCLCGRARPEFGVTGGIPICCAKCKQPNHINLYRKKNPCEVQNCTKTGTYGTPETGPVRCANHKNLGDNNNRGCWCCTFPGCIRVPTVIMRDDKFQYCSEHAPGDLVFIKPFYRCKMDGCDNRAIYIRRGSQISQPNIPLLYCKKHRTEECVLPYPEFCEMDGCDKTSYYLCITLGKYYCSAHGLLAKNNNKVVRISNMCVAPGCPVRSTFGDETGVKIFCKAHKTDEKRFTTAITTCTHTGCSRPVDMAWGTTHCRVHRIALPVDNKFICIHPGCVDLAIYQNQINITHCEIHKSPEETPVITPIKFGYCAAVSGCPGYGSYVISPNSKIFYCVVHRTPGMTLRHPVCAEPGCISEPKYGPLFTRPFHCAVHKKNNEHENIDLRCWAPDCNNVPGFQLDTDVPGCRNHIDKPRVRFYKKVCTGCGLREYMIRRVSKCGVCRSLPGDGRETGHPHGPGNSSNGSLSGDGRETGHPHGPGNSSNGSLSGDGRETGHPHGPGNSNGSLPGPGVAQNLSGSNEQSNTNISQSRYPMIPIFGIMEFGEAEESFEPTEGSGSESGSDQSD